MLCHLVQDTGTSLSCGIEMCRLVVYNYEPVASSAAHTTAAWPCTIFSDGTSSTSHRGATTVTIVIAGTAFNSDIIRDTNSSSGTYGTSRSTSLTSTGSKRHSIADKGRISAIRSRPTRATQPVGIHRDGVRLAWFYRYFGANVRTRSASVRVATTATAAPYLYDDIGHARWYGPSMRTDMSGSDRGPCGPTGPLGPSGPRGPCGPGVP